MIVSDGGGCDERLLGLVSSSTGRPPLELHRRRQTLLEIMWQPPSIKPETLGVPK